MYLGGIQITTGVRSACYPQAASTICLGQNLMSLWPLPILSSNKMVAFAPNKDDGKVMWCTAQSSHRNVATNKDGGSHVMESRETMGILNR